MLEEKDLQAIAQLINASLDTKLAPVNDQLDRVEGRLDLDVGKRLDALAEGQSVIEKRLDILEVAVGEVKELAEGTRDKVDVIHAVVTQHSKSITELKKVQ